MMQDYDPEDPLDLAQLRAASDASITQSQPACEMRLKMLRRLVGPYYPGDGESGKEKRPVNLLGLAVDIWQRGLASHFPQVIVETDYEELLPTATDFETVLNRKIKRMKLKESLNICAIEALFTIGVMCVGVGLDGEYDGGSAFAEPVLFPDLILDWSAQSWETQSYVGHEFLVPMEWVEGNEDLLPEPRDQFVEWQRNQQFATGRDWQRATSALSQQYEKLVRFRQLYLPRRKKTVLFAVDGPIRDALRTSDWTGPYCGPYIPLAFRTVPGNVFPLAPLLPLYDLDDFANKAYSKAFRQADRCKTIGLTQSPDDASIIGGAGDGDIKGVSDPNAVVEKKFGGADQNVVDAANLSQHLFMYLGGNLELAGGLAPSSSTVGQDQLLAKGASGKMTDMQDAMTAFQTEVITSIGYWTWADPTSEERFTKRLEGTDFGIPAMWSPETRSGEFFQFNLSVNPYSYVKRSPSEQAQFITQILEQVILPALPYMQQGSPIDWEYYFKMLARYNNSPEINMLLNWPGGDSMPGPTPDDPGMPKSTKRTYERINSQGAGQSPLQAAQQQFSASSAQNGQMMEGVAS